MRNAAENLLLAGWSRNVNGSGGGDTRICGEAGSACRLPRHVRAVQRLVHRGRRDLQRRGIVTTSGAGRLYLHQGLSQH